MEINSALISGSGPSLKETDLSRIPSDVYIIRTNNFYLEDRYYLGDKIDCIYFSGDKRALRFYIATLRKVFRLNIYDARLLTSHHSAALRLNPGKPVEAFAITDPDVQRLIDAHAAKTPILPTTGVMAALKAYQLGATQIYFAGIDFYQGDQKYFVDLPPRLNKVVAPNMQPQGYDERLHSRALDQDVLALLSAKGVTLFSTSETSSSLFQLAPVLTDHLVVSRMTKIAHVDDWVRFDGIYPLWALLTARKLRAFLGKFGLES